MSIEQLYALVKAAKESMLLQDQLNSATTADEVAAIAKNVGIIISAETIMKAQNVDRTVSEDELEGLSDGGNSPAELLGALLDRLKDEGKYSGGCQPRIHLLPAFQLADGTRTSENPA